MIKENPIDEAERIQQAVLMREVEEEIQKEKLLNFWKKYRFLIIGGIIGVVAFTCGNEVYRMWYEKTRLSESNRFEQAVILNYTGNSEEAAKIYLDLAQNAHTGYKELALLRLAAIAHESGDDKNAGIYLKQVIESGESPELKDAARVTYVGYQIDQNPNEALLAFLQPVLNQPANALYASAVELQAALLVKLKKNQEAKQAIQNALSNQFLTPVSKDRLNALSAVIK